MGKPYYEQPEWILKSIVYFCDNYTIDGKDLEEKKSGAIKQYKRGIQCAIDGSFVWTGHDFWQSLFWLQGGIFMGSGNKCTEPSCGVKCKPWTNAEKRMIAKMPKVKV